MPALFPIVAILVVFVFISLHSTATSQPRRRRSDYGRDRGSYGSSRGSSSRGGSRDHGDSRRSSKRGSSDRYSDSYSSRGDRR